MPKKIYKIILFFKNFLREKTIRQNQFMDMLSDWEQKMAEHKDALESKWSLF
jgi:hypothetical protein